jgi:hypothetical protein
LKETKNTRALDEIFVNLLDMALRLSFPNEIGHITYFQYPPIKAPCGLKCQKKKKKKKKKAVGVIRFRGLDQSRLKCVRGRKAQVKHRERNSGQVKKQ